MGIRQETRVYGNSLGYEGKHTAQLVDFRIPTLRTKVFSFNLQIFGASYFYIIGWRQGRIDSFFQPKSRIVKSYMDTLFTHKKTKNKIK